MTADRISVAVQDDGAVRAVRHRGNRRSPVGRVAYSGLDAAVVTLFERWLTLRDRDWRPDEIEVFGSLLHRCLFPETVWSWIETTMREAVGGPVRLELIFPVTGSYARLAAIPWEYLYRPAHGPDLGWFLAASPRLVLCRYIPLPTGEPLLPPLATPRILVVVSQPRDRRLDAVDYADVVSAIQTWAAARGFPASVLHDPTAVELRAAVARTPGQRPDIVHFMGHGRFDPELGGALALSDPDGGTDWLPQAAIADVFGRGLSPPRIVVLHCCDAGRTDYQASLAGVAPYLARAGAAAVVAMQYPVTNSTAIAFSLALYDELASGRPLDQAVQEGRWAISRLRADRDPRLMGVPVLYLQNDTSTFSLPAKGVDEP
jgi:hypothetical protein